MFHGAFHPQDGFLSTISYRAFPSVGPFWPNWRPQFAVQYKSGNNKHGEIVLCQSVFLPRLTTFRSAETPIDTCKNLKYWEGELGLGRVECGRQREALAQGPRPSEARPCEAPKAPRSPCKITKKHIKTRWH